MRWSLPLALLVGACGGVAPHPAAEPFARTARLDSASVRRLCAQPDSVLAGKSSCDLRDQRQQIKVF